MSENKHRCNFSGNKNEWEDFQKIAKAKDVSASSLLRDLIRKYIEKNKKLLK